MRSIFAEHHEWFQNYVQNKIRECAFDPFPMALKLRHTDMVLENATKISQSSPQSEADAVILAALYHDIARFDQYLRHKTFKDAISFNHGAAGVKILKKEKRLDALDKKTRSKILTAVGLHNRYRLPQNLPPDFQRICGIIRDADKLDILRVIEEHLSGPGPYSPTVILSLPDNGLPGNPLVTEKVLQNQVASYNDLKNVNDFRLLLGAWFFDMHSERSKDLYIQTGHGVRLVQALPDNDHYAAAKRRLLTAFAQFREKAANPASQTTKELANGQ